MYMLLSVDKINVEKSDEEYVSGTHIQWCSGKSLSEAIKLARKTEKVNHNMNIAVVDASYDSYAMGRYYSKKKRLDLNYIGFIKDGVPNIEEILQTLGDRYIYVYDDVYFIGKELYSMDFLPMGIYHKITKDDLNKDKLRLDKDKSVNVKPMFSYTEYCNNEVLQKDIDTLLSLGSETVFLKTKYTNGERYLLVGHINYELLEDIYKVFKLESDIFYEEMADFMNFSYVRKLESKLKDIKQAFFEKYPNVKDSNISGVGIDKISSIMGFMDRVLPEDIMKNIRSELVCQ